MNYQKLNKICNRFIWVASFILLFTAFMCVAGCSVWSHLGKTLVEIEELERTGLLHNPPDTISADAKLEIKLVHNSEGLRKYINETKESVIIFGYTFFVISFIFLFSIILKFFVWIKLRRLRNFSAQEG
ncbi:MAG: hypothetical protein V4544_03415 [Pseudomonadota bacterium]